MMKKLIRILPLIVLLHATLTSAIGTELDVFILGGQSNAAGRGDMSELPDSSVFYNENIMLYHSPNMNSGQPAGQWTTLRPASNTAGYFGPEIGFGDIMSELYPDRHLAIIKHAVGGTDLGANWNPGNYAGDTTHFGPQYAIFVETVNSGINSLIAQGYTPVIRGMLWQQGERDARDGSFGPAYDRNLSHFIKRVRAEFSAPNLPFIYGQVLPVVLAGYDYRDQVRQGQFNVDEGSGHLNATDGARLVMADDLPMNSDNLHVSALGQIELGTRFAQAISTVAVANSVDFNGDKRIDSADVCALIEYWQKNEPAYDVAPPPFGNGIVDVQDMIIVADHLFFEIPPVELIAYWKLDEIDGSIALDSVGRFDGTLNGNPQWQPVDGKKDGAVHFDGIDDFISTPFILDPALSSFSVFAYVKGGIPGQVILSQEGCTNWIMLDLNDGSLRTDLKEPATEGRGATPAGPPLISSAVVNDGNWHQVGFVRDESGRILYVDGIEVAHDTADNLESGEGGLYFGASYMLETDGFFSGFIDDIRIYDKALTRQEIAAIAQ